MTYESQASGSGRLLVLKSRSPGAERGRPSLLVAPASLLFVLRKVDQKDLIAHAGQGVPLGKKGPAASKVLDAESLSDVFGIEIAETVRPVRKTRPPGRASSQPADGEPAAAPAAPPGQGVRKGKRGDAAGPSRGGRSRQGAARRGPDRIRRRRAG